MAWAFCYRFEMLRLRIAYVYHIYSLRMALWASHTKLRSVTSHCLSDLINLLQAPSLMKASSFVNTSSKLGNNSGHKGISRWERSPVRCGHVHL